MAVMVEGSNVERTRFAWECFNRRDAEGLMSICVPDVEFTTFVGEMEGRVYRGAEGVREWFANVDETFDEFAPEVVDVTDVGNGVVTEVQIRGSLGGLPLEQRAFQLIEIRSGLATRWSWYRTREEALAAAEDARQQ
jgi:ketosteroid isomerase-like protein